MSLRPPDTSHAASRSKWLASALIAVGACVSVCGAIGFVGLIAPYAGWLLTRGHPGRAILPAGAIGAILLLLADLLVRWLRQDGSSR